jgi:hypothetical protein
MKYASQNAEMTSDTIAQLYLLKRLVLAYANTKKKIIIIISYIRGTRKFTAFLRQAA